MKNASSSLDFQCTKKTSDHKEWIHLKVEEQISKKFSLLRALKSPQKFRTPSSANFFGSLHIWGFKSKSYYEIWTF